MNPRQGETVLCERHAQDRAWLDRRPAGRPVAILRRLRLRTVEVVVEDQCDWFQKPVSVRAFVTGDRIPMDLVLSARAAKRLNPERELSASGVSCSALECCAVAPVRGRPRARRSGGTGRRDDRCGEAHEAFHPLAGDEVTPAAQALFTSVTPLRMPAPRALSVARGPTLGAACTPREP